ncbi:MAG: hypothetical protein AB7J32_21510 [Pseudonocardia sp.]
MTDLATMPHPAIPRPVTRAREDTSMLLHEALARSRSQEAQEAARRYRLARAARQAAAADRPVLLRVLLVPLRRTARARAAAARRAARAS